MGKTTDIRIVNTGISFEPVVYRTPLKFGGRTVTESKLINVEVTVETRGKKRGVGFGSMPIGNIWAWPGAGGVTPEQAEAAMIDFANRAVGLTEGFIDVGHPIELMFILSAEYAHLAKLVSEKYKLPEIVPELARLVAASPLDAAVHDAYGKAIGINSYDALSSKFMNDDLSEYLDDQFEAGKTFEADKADWLDGQWHGIGLPEDDERRGKTAVPAAKLTDYGHRLTPSPTASTCTRR